MKLTKVGFSRRVLDGLIIVGKKNLKLDTKTGSNDSVFVYKSGSYYIAYSENRRHNYVGLEVWNTDGVLTDEVFFQEGNLDPKDMDWLENSTRVPSKIRFLLQYTG